MGANLRHEALSCHGRVKPVKPGHDSGAGAFKLAPMRRRGDDVADQSGLLTFGITPPGPQAGRPLPMEEARLRSDLTGWRILSHVRRRESLRAAGAVATFLPAAGLRL